MELDNDPKGIELEPGRDTGAAKDLELNVVEYRGLGPCSGAADEEALEVNHSEDEERERNSSWSSRYGNAMLCAGLALATLAVSYHFSDISEVLHQASGARQELESGRGLAVVQKHGDFSDYAAIQGNIFEKFEAWKLALTTVLVVSFGSLGAAAGIGGFEEGAHIGGSGGG